MPFCISHYLNMTSLPHQSNLDSVYCRGAHIKADMNRRYTKVEQFPKSYSVAVCDKNVILFP